MPKTINLSSRQIAALRTYADAHGKTWRRKLADSWLSGGDHLAQSDGYLLQELRNELGPKWLSAYKLPPKVQQSEYTLKLRVWGTKPKPVDWHHDALDHIAPMIRDGYTSGQLGAEDADGGWWEITHEET